MATAIQFLRSATTSLRPDPVSLEDGMPMLNYGTVEPGLFFALEDDSLMKIGPTHVGDTAPNFGPQGFSGNAKGEQWLDTTGTGATLKVYDGTQWLANSFSLSGDSLITDSEGARLNENSTDFATFPRNSSGNGYNLSGFIGFGTSSPTHTVSVNGGLRLVDQVDYPAGNLGALAVVGGAFLFHNGSTWTNILANSLWEQVGNDTFYDQGDVLIGAGSPGSPSITLTSTGAGAFDGGGSFGNDVTVGGDGLTTVGVIAQSSGSVSINKADATACLELRENGTVKTSLTAGGSATFAGEIETTTAGDGIILASPDGTRYRLTIANGGTVNVAAA